MTCSELFVSQYGRDPEVCAAAPGRVEFIGNHTDYNGGRVIGAAIDRKLHVAVSRRRDHRIRLVSSASPLPLETDLEKPDAGSDWVRYPLAVLQVMRAEGMRTPSGFDFAVAGDLPPGSGLSSSAALELATAFALAGLYGLDRPRADMIRMCRRAENDYVGVPCGILDQGVCGFGREDHLVLIDCFDERFTLLGVPSDWVLWVFNSGVKHALVDSLYTTRHDECREAYRILRARGSAAPCLARVEPAEVHAAAAALGEPLYQRARHVVEENQRVGKVWDAITRGEHDGVGQVLRESHASSRDLFANSCAELDYLVDALCAAPGVRGARLSGGGFGGAAMALTSRAFNEDTAAAIHAAYQRKFTRDCSYFRTGIAAGAACVPC